MAENPSRASPDTGELVDDELELLLDDDELVDDELDDDELELLLEDEELDGGGVVRELVGDLLLDDDELVDDELDDDVVDELGVLVDVEVNA